MNIDDLRRLYDYNRWANLRLLDAAATLSETQFTTGVTSSFSSLRDTFAHIIGVERLWAQRCNGERQAGWPEWMKEATAARLREELDQVRDAQQALIDTADLERRVNYINFKGEEWEYSLGEVLYHVANHSNYHRGQVVTILRQLGAAPPATDYLIFIEQTR